MASQSMTKPLGIIKNLKIPIHGIPYIATFIVLQNNVVKLLYVVKKTLVQICKGFK
jgi:hypothetical protein